MSSIKAYTNKPVSQMNQDERAFLEEKKDFSKIHKANACLFLLYGIVYGFIIFLFMLWHLQPPDLMASQIEASEENTEIMSFFANAIRSSINIALSNGTRNDGLN